MQHPVLACRFAYQCDRFLCLFLNCFIDIDIFSDLLGIHVIELSDYP